MFTITTSTQVLGKFSYVTRKPTIYNIGRFTLQFDQRTAIAQVSYASLLVVTLVWSREQALLNLWGFKTYS